MLLQEQIRQARREEDDHAQDDEYGHYAPDVLGDFLCPLVE